MVRQIHIIGAGIGGLTLAIALLTRGFPVRVFEQAAALGELGAGLTLPVTSMRVFHALGLGERIAAITDRSRGTPYVHYQTGALLQGTIDPVWDAPAGAEDRGQTHRGALHRVLAAEVARLDPRALVPAHRLTTVSQASDRIRAHFENGATEDSELLISCDGVRSAGYRAIFGRDNPARFTGVVAIRATIPRDTAEPYLRGGRALRFVRPGRGFHRYGILRGSLINVIALAEASAWREEGWSHACTRAEFAALFGDFHEDVRGLISVAPENQLFKWALFDREPLACWSRGRATLLGDAAHPMLPYLAQGATAAIEDALVLARALESYRDHQEAFAAYEAERRPRTAQQMRASREQGAALNQADPHMYVKARPDLDALLAYDAAQVRV